MSLFWKISTSAALLSPGAAVYALGLYGMSTCGLGEQHCETGATFFALLGTVALGAGLLGAFSIFRE